MWILVSEFPVSVLLKMLLDSDLLILELQSHQSSRRGCGCGHPVGDTTIHAPNEHFSS